jgi:uroporphyrinogen-III decarboxylase
MREATYEEMASKRENSRDSTSEQITAEGDKALQKPWEDMTAEERMDRRFANWLSPGRVPSKSPAEQAYRARVARLTASMRLRGTPDRVPVPLATAEGYPSYRAGLTPYDCMYDFDRAAEAFLQFHDEFHPDAMISPYLACLPGRAYDLIDYALYSWPGHGISKQAPFQYNEHEWMMPSEYDSFLADPSDFLLRTYLPRVAPGLEGFAKLGTALGPTLLSSCSDFAASWADPAVQTSLARITAAGNEVRGWMAKLQKTDGEIRAKGFPSLFEGMTLAPFDFVGDNLRGTKGIFTDLFRAPGKVLAACERIVPLMIRWVVEKSSPDTLPAVFVPLHKGADSFMSEQQFRTFYWPSLLMLIRGLNAEGFMPVLFAEGSYTSRLEIVAADLPPGKTVWYFDRVDIALAKRTVGRVACIQGNVPLSLLHAGSPADVTAYCQTLIETAAPNGGFLLDIGAAMYQGNDDNLRAMMRSVLDYGVY